jgi:hypothetical protein
MRRAMLLGPMALALASAVRLQESREALVPGLELLPHPTPAQLGIVGTTKRPGKEIRADEKALDEPAAASAWPRGAGCLGQRNHARLAAPAWVQRWPGG